MFKSEIRNSCAQPRRARAAAQSVRTCGAITRCRSRQHAVGARLAELVSAARSRRSASTTLAAPCMQPACKNWRSSARWPAAQQQQPGAATEMLNLHSAAAAAAAASRRSDKPAPQAPSAATCLQLPARQTCRLLRRRVGTAAAAASTAAEIDLQLTMRRGRPRRAARAVDVSCGKGSGDRRSGVKKAAEGEAPVAGAKTRAVDYACGRLRTVSAGCSL